MTPVRESSADSAVIADALSLHLLGQGQHLPELLREGVSLQRANWGRVHSPAQSLQLCDRYGKIPYSCRTPIRLRGKASYLTDQLTQR